MKRRMRLLIAAALLGLCGCHNGNFHVEEAGDGIPLSECNLVGGMEKCLASGDVTLALDGGYAPELPAPLDLVMPELHSRLGDRRLTVIRPPQDGIVNEWTLYKHPGLVIFSDGMKFWCFAPAESERSGLTVSGNEYIVGGVPRAGVYYRTRSAFAKASA